MGERYLRFAIRENQLRAATWKIWSRNSNSDIYLTCRELKGAIKASLHQSGSWHIGYSDSASEKYFESREDFEKSKFIEIWPKPKPISDGTVLAFRIVTPFSAIRSSVDNTRNDIIWIPNCSTGYATEIDIMITTVNITSANWPGRNKMGTKLVGSYDLANKERVWVVYWQIPMPDLSSISGKPFKFYKGKTKADLSKENLKAIIFADENDGSRTLFDFSVENNCS